MKPTLTNMRETRIQLNNLLLNSGNSNQVFDINQKLDILENFFAEFDKSGKFADEEVRVRGGINVQQKNDAEKKEQSDEVFYARVVLARAGLTVQQKTVPTLKQIADRCLEIAGTAAVRQACTPSRMEGTDWQGKPYAQSAPEFTLPEGYETLGSKIKSAIGI
jgi:hypothetical protein